MIIIGYVESYSSGDPSVMGLTWDEIDYIPSGFADNTDDDTLGQISCANGQVLKYVGSGWLCENDKYQPTTNPYRVYELHDECDIAYHNYENRELVFTNYCYVWLRTSAAPSGCVLITSKSTKRAECSGTTRICPTRTEYLFRCPNELVDYAIDIDNSFD